MTLYIDEGLLGSCDPEHMHHVIKNMLPALRVRLFMISHHEELRAAMTHTIRVAHPLHSGEQRVIIIKTIEPDDSPKKSNKPKKVKARPFHCDVCNVDITTQKYFDRHVAGAEHKIRAGL